MQCIKVVVSQNKCIMPLMKFRKELDAKKKDKKEKKKKRRNK